MARLRVAAAGLACVNGGTFGLFWYDKKIAEANGPKEARAAGQRAADPSRPKAVAAEQRPAAALEQRPAAVAEQRPPTPVMRVSEDALCCTALLGGWPAGYLSMQVLRHKSVKKSFQEKYAMATGCNLLLLAALHPGIRAAVQGLIAK
mmetsp:Transcript_98083/g.278034  ORF Transcript_98083/g.278034 Transcript_98083/m.278034 type:complete len:148 (+) Transcript_98083:56-499(+)|eukprot:CAMPEP_0179250320 /NCGR_PEP_ID=MMETSP0797-20121207/21108_1 /TAXON_ID=47934 /ORGANISM="Dinophysis acuminata, Strain DAEP01" /LENGTH=147 /DNA_ID=CAMNT_0020958055 /DNA_START=56 /DNA_END=499 /DNA_ORIENTATION=+